MARFKYFKGKFIAVSIPEDDYYGNYYKFVAQNICFIEGKTMNTIFTIGHSQHPIEHFIKLLKKNNINYVIDVRSNSYLKYAQEYDRENIENVLKQNNIKYSFMGKHLVLGKRIRRYILKRGI